MEDVKRFGAKLLHIFSQNQPLDSTLFRQMQAVKIDEKLMMSEKSRCEKFPPLGQITDQVRSNFTALTPSGTLFLHPLFSDVNFNRRPDFNGD
ncbi:Uncharacterised protein [Mannheimia haemolytica]|uniref:Uncharacterized protein n=1 Tax=Mannheimia haemolytica TaxID=75985 RepID=A0A378MT90_MANHA|nr:Uncharacterised protein [Mannheimia haemolytica]